MYESFTLHTTRTFASLPRAGRTRHATSRALLFALLSNGWAAGPNSVRYSHTLLCEYFGSKQLAITFQLEA